MTQQTVTLKFNLATAAGNNVTVGSLNLGFQPDAVILRQITYSDAAADENIYFIWTTMLDQNIVGSFHGDKFFAVAPNSMFLLPSYSNRSFQWQIQDFNGAINGTIAGNLAVTLEFLKYAPTA